MTSPRMRPVFAMKLASNATPLEALRKQLALDDSPCDGTIFRNHAVLQIRPEYRHFWSPHLNLEVRANENGVGSIHGRFSPHPDVWTAFIAGYGILLMIALGGLVFGLAQISLGSTPWALAVSPAAIALGAFLYGAAFIGQGLGAEQMYEMRSFVNEALKQ